MCWSGITTHPFIWFNTKELDEGLVYWHLIWLEITFLRDDNWL